MLAVVALGITALAIVAYGTHLLRSLELSTVNTRFSIRGAERPSKNIVLVKVDDKTFQDLNLQWPFPRATHGRLVDRIGAEHPAVIAFDIQFSEPSSRGQNDDVALLNALNRYPGKTVFTFTETDKHGNVIFLGSGEGTKLLAAVGARAGNGLYPFDPGGVIRRMSFSIGGLDTFPIVVAAVARHHKPPPTGSRKGSAWIDFAGPGGTFPSLSYSQAYYGTYSGTPHGTPLPGDYFRNKIVVVGATAPSLQDVHPTSTDSQMTGPEVQANAINTVLRGFPLSAAPGWLNIVLIVLLAMTVPVASVRLGPIAAMGIAVVLGALFALGVQIAFDSGRIVSFVYPLGALILSAGGSLAVQLVTEAFERIRVRDLFARFVPEDVVDEVLASADGFRLGGVQREGTVMFTDLRGFTSRAESLEPARVIEILNRYLGEMSDAILDHGGTLVAYMGDGIMAVFGAPLPQEDHADRALSAAREMLSVRLGRFNAWLRAEGLGDGFRMGIGLNSGSVMSGHVGSERRVEYTAVGDTTNTASRIEQLTKGSPNQLLLSGSTRDALRAPPDNLVRVGETEIRGRAGTIELWSLPEVPEVEQALAAEPLPA
jgi:adenylate cyclase